MFIHFCSDKNLRWLAFLSHSASVSMSFLFLDVLDKVQKQSRTERISRQRTSLSNTQSTVDPRPRTVRDRRASRWTTSRAYARKRWLKMIQKDSTPTYQTTSDNIIQLSRQYHMRGSFSQITDCCNVLSFVCSDSDMLLFTVI